MGSYNPFLRRQDSIGLFFHSTPFVSMELVSKVLLCEMNIKCDEIVGVQHLSRNKIVVKFGSKDIFNRIVNDYEDQTLKINESETVKIINLSSSVTYVSVRNAPFEMDDELITNILSRYGKVENVRNNRFSVGPFRGLLSGVRTVRMRIKENIPSSIYVSGHNLSLIHNGQKKTCYRCGKEGHLVKDCEVDMAAKTNIWSEEDFPEMNSKNNIERDVINTSKPGDDDEVQ